MKQVTNTEPGRQETRQGGTDSFRKALLTQRIK